MTKEKRRKKAQAQYHLKVGNHSFQQYHNLLVQCYDKN